MKIAWLSDIHLDHLSNEKFVDFVDSLVKQDVDAYFLTGDICHGLFHETVFNIFERFLHSPMFFVLGNHDFYHSSFDKVAERITEFADASDSLFWMNNCGIIELNENTCVIGHDGWYDGRNGKFFNTEAHLSDFLFIEELVDLENLALYQKLNELGDYSAKKIKQSLLKAIDQFDNIYLLTHVPPFEEASFHLDGLSDVHGLPFFSCKAIGDTLREIMEKNTEKHLTVLCGHTHTGGEVSILPNLHVKVAQAEYGKPDMQEIIEI